MRLGCGKATTTKTIRASVALLVLCACVRYRPQPVSVTANADALTARTLDSEVVRRVVARHHPEAAATWPPPAWTPELLTLAAVALHPDLDVARAEWDAARAALLTAAERPNPAASIGVERKSGSGSTSPPMSPPMSPWITTLALDVPIETAGKRGARVAEAKALSAAAAADVDQAIWNVRTRAANGIVDLAASRRLSEVRRNEVRLRDEVVAMFERRLEVGESAQPDVTRVRAEARAARVLLREEEGRSAEREAALAAAIGIGRASLPPLDLSMADPAPIADENRLRTLALTSRPDVLATLARYDAADQALRLEVRRQFPDLHVGPGIGWDQGSFKWALSAAAELPLFNRHRGAIAEAEARRSAAAARLLALQAQVLGDLDVALASERSARARVDEAERLVTNRQALAASARRQFDAGEIDRLALRSQDVEVVLAEIDRWTAWYDLQRAMVAVEAAIEQPM